jgi:hypothetical protein
VKNKFNIVLLPTVEEVVNYEVGQPYREKLIIAVDRSMGVLFLSRPAPYDSSAYLVDYRVYKLLKLLRSLNINWREGEQCRR